MSKRDFFTSQEHDALEGQLFRFLICREGLWDLIDRYRGQDPKADSRGFLMALQAASLQADYSSRLLLKNDDDDVLKDKLNEAFHRSAIAKGSFDKIFQSVTDPKNLVAMQAAWSLYLKKDCGVRKILFPVTNKEFV